MGVRLSRRFEAWVLCLCVGVVGLVTRTATAQLPYVSGQVLVTFAEGYMPTAQEVGSSPPFIGQSSVDALFAEYGAIRLEKIIPSYEEYSSTEGRWLERTFTLTYSDAIDPAELAADWSQLPYFETVTVNEILDWELSGELRLAPGDTTMFSQQWNYDNADTGDRTDVDLPEAWAIELGLPGVAIGIFDTGVSLDVSTSTWKLHSDFNYLWIDEEDVASPGVLTAADIDGVDNNNDGLGTHAWAYKANIIGFNLKSGFDADTAPDAEYRRLLWYGLPHSWQIDYTCPGCPDSWDVIDYSQHGVWVASLAAGKLDGLKPGTLPAGKDIVGAAPNSQVYWARFSEAQSSDHMAKAIEHLSKKVKVINMSFGGPSSSNAVRVATEIATRDNDCLLVAATGNDDLSVNYPAKYDNVFAVGAMDRDPLVLATFSNWTPGLEHVDVVAPTGEGDELFADSFTDCVVHPCPIVETAEFFNDKGTSFAAPQVSGIAALVRSRFPGYTQGAIQERLRGGAEFYWQSDLNGVYKYGKGKVNAYRALTEHGSITEDVIWTANTQPPDYISNVWTTRPGSRDGKYYVSGDLTIESGASLTIAAGTVVRVAPDHDRTGADQDRVLIVVKSGGSLVINGTAENPVVFEGFTDSAPTSSDWVGVKFESGSSATISHVVFRNAQRAIENYAPLTSTSSVTNCTFTQCGTAIEAHANVTATGTLIANNDVAVDIFSGTTSLTKCTIADNEDWAMVTRTGTSLSVNKCVMAFNGGPAVRALSGGTSLASMSNSVVWANENDGSSRTDNDWDTVGTNVYKMDPHFCGAAGEGCGDYGEYCLNAASPAVAPVPPSQGLFGERVGAFDIGCAPSTTIVPSVLAQACPAGDAGALQVIVDLEAATRTIPGDEFRLDIQDLVSIVFDSDGILPAIGSAGPSLYQASIVHGSFGARSGGPAPGCLCSHNDAADVLLNGYLLPAQASVTIRSPDLNGDGTVDVQDFSKFGYGGFPQNSVPAGDCRDFNGDGAKNIQDYAFYGLHNNHSAQFSAQNVPSQAASSNATVALEFTDEYQTATTHKLFVNVTVDNFAGITTALFALAARNERLTFSEWREGEGSIGTVIVAPIARDNEEQHYFGLLISDSFQGTTASLGQLVFDVEGAEPFEVIQDHFVLVTGEVLLESEGGQQVVAQMGGGVSLTFDPATARVYHDRLEQNFPNPFNPTTTLAYSLKSASNVTLTIFDVAGRRIRELVNERRERGAYRVVWDGRNDQGMTVSSGVYFYKLVAGSFTDTKKMTILK